MNGAMVGAYTHANKALEDAFPRVPADIRRFLAGSSGARTVKTDALIERQPACHFVLVHAEKVAN